MESLLGTSLEDPRTMAVMSAVQGLLGGRGLLQGLASGAQAYGGTMQAAKQQQAAEELRKLQLQQHALQLKQMQDAAAQQAMDKQLTQTALSPIRGIEANRASGITGPRPEALSVVGQTPAFDPRQFVSQGGSLQGAASVAQLLAKEQPKIEKFAPGEVGGYVKDGKWNQVVSVSPKDDQPTALKEYNFAKAQGYPGSFLDFQLEQKRAGAPSTMVKVENKTGESLASQVGPMVKDSRIQTQGAVKMFDAADRLDRALNSELVTSGPLASTILTAKQFAQVIGGGNDESIRQTRQAIKSLAQMAVEARKQLQGQGQVTDSEAAAVAKADAGDINDLTPGEMRDLVTLTKRAAHIQAKSHQDLIGTLGGKDETKGLVPFYNVQGLDPLLKYEPTLPQIGGGWSMKLKAK